MYLCVIEVYFFSLLYNILFSKYAIVYLSYCLFNRHLGCLQFEAIMNNSAMKFLYMFLAHISGEEQTRSEISEAEITHTFNLEKLANEFSKMSVPIYTSTIV